MAVLVKKLNETTELKEKLEYDLKATQSSNSMLTKEQLEAFFDVMKSIDISTPENKAFLIDVFVNSVYVYDDDSVVITTNFRGEDGLFLKRAMVRLPKRSVHQTKYQTNFLYVDDEVFGFKIDFSEKLNETCKKLGLRWRARR